MLHHHPSAAQGFAAAAATWLAMMSVMMAPAVWPWVNAFHRFASGDEGSTIHGTVLFAAGYLASWSGYSVAAAAIQMLVHTPSAVAPSVFLLAGLFQFAPQKRACLAHCRNPFSYFLSRWRRGPAGAFRMGLGHGFYCVGCCWALMLTMLAVGTTNIWWMAALTAVAFAEQVAARGHLLRIPVGFALLLAAARM